MNASKDLTRDQGLPFRSGARTVLAACALVLVAGLPSALYAPDAEARCCRRAGWFVGGAIVGAAIARPWPAYVYGPPAVYYAPPVYYAPVVTSAVTTYAPPVAYVPPAPGSTIITYPTPTIQRLTETPPAAAATTPVAPAAGPASPVAALSIEERLRRLQSICAQGLLDAGECQIKRQELLREM